jgi:hypothetical protein
MHAHRLDVRGDRSVEEREARAARVLSAERVEAALALPELEDTVLQLGQVERRPDRAEARLA